MKCDSSGIASEGWLSSISRSRVVPEREQPTMNTGVQLSAGMPADRCGTAEDDSGLTIIELPNPREMNLN